MRFNQRGAPLHCVVRSLNFGSTSSTLSGGLDRGRKFLSITGDFGDWVGAGHGVGPNYHRRSFLRGVFNRSICTSRWLNTAEVQHWGLGGGYLEPLDSCGASASSGVALGRGLFNHHPNLPRSNLNMQEKVLWYCKADARQTHRIGKSGECRIFSFKPQIPGISS